MATTTVAFAIALILLGLIGYFATGRVSVTALIPAFFGALLLALGLLAHRHRAAVALALGVALLGLLGAVPGLLKLPALLGGEPVARPAAVIAQSLMALLAGAYLILGVRAFRRSRP